MPPLPPSLHSLPAVAVFNSNPLAQSLAILNSYLYQIVTGTAVSGLDPPLLAETAAILIAVVKGTPLSMLRFSPPLGGRGKDIFGAVVPGVTA